MLDAFRYGKIDQPLLQLVTGSMFGPRRLVD
jgi:hypothetical protein